MARVEAIDAAIQISRVLVVEEVGLVEGNLLGWCHKATPLWVARELVAIANASIVAAGVVARETHVAGHAVAGDACVRCGGRSVAREFVNVAVVAGSMTVAAGVVAVVVGVVVVAIGAAAGVIVVGGWSFVAATVVT